MDVRENLGVSLVFAVYVALFVLCDCSLCPRAQAQKSADTNQDSAATDPAASDPSEPSIEPADTTESERTVEQSNEPSRRPDPVFQAQTAPPPRPTLAEQTPALLKQSAEKSASIELETTQSPPPAPVEEQRPSAPGVHYIWVPGFWYWYNVQFVWIPGRWIAPRPGFVFVGPRWTRRAGIWVFLPGGWAVIGGTSIVYPLDIGFFIRPWPRARGYHRHGGHFARPHRSGRAYHSPSGRRPRARITSRHATQPRSRARQR